ncbi:TPA: hypothetical protein ACQ7G7_001034 [Klebsiella pneumoniae]|nr:hypothetical protein [Klebsiella pneumoniae]
MDSEPVAYIDKQWTLVYYVPPMSMGLKIGDKLYRHAQQPVDSEPVGYLFHNEYGAVLYSISDDATEGFSLIGPIYSVPQPAPTVPDAYVRDEHGRMMLNGVCEPKIGFGTGWNACRAAMLKDQPQNAPQNIPEIIPGWIPVSEQKPDCWCLTCRHVTLNDMRFVVCPDCGNKRCPRANDHRNACTGSNEPGQDGSAYPAAPQEVRGA